MKAKITGRRKKGQTQNDMDTSNSQWRTEERQNNDRNEGIGERPKSMQEMKEEEDEESFNECISPKIVVSHLQSNKPLGNIPL